MVGFIMLLWSWKNAVDGVLRLSYGRIPTLSKTVQFLHKKSSNIPLRLWCRLMLNPYLPVFLWI